MKRINDLKGVVIVILSLGILGTIFGVPDPVIVILTIITFGLGGMFLFIGLLGWVQDDDFLNPGDAKWSNVCVVVGIVLLAIAVVVVWQGELIAA